MNHTSYRDYLAAKEIRYTGTGLDWSPCLASGLWDFQAAITQRMVEQGRGAVFADCGLGKTRIELEWARHCVEAGHRVLYLTPLAVAPQIVAEAAEMAIFLDSIEVANYQRLHRYDPADFGAIVLDESSILKALDGVTRRALTAFVAEGDIDLRLAATATPAPNDVMELLNHADWLGIMSADQARALWMVNDGDHTSKWRLKGHAAADFWRWVRSWAATCRTPADMGCGVPASFVQPPPYRIVEAFHTKEADAPSGRLFADTSGISALRQSRRDGLAEAVQVIAGAVAAEPDESWVIWCELNAESEAVAKAIPGAVEIRGGDPIETKEAVLNGFAAGEHRVLVSKPSMTGHGLNWQHCARMAWISAGYSYEQWYQAIRRCWRQGQRREVRVLVTGGEASRHALAVLRRKEDEAMMIYNAPAGDIRPTPKVEMMPDGGPPAAHTESGEKWKLMLGDSVDTVRILDDESVGLSVFSPPFPGMYVYTDDPRDMGNSHKIEEMVEGFGYLARAMRPKIMPGRSVLIHLTQGVAQKVRDGFIGLRDFRGAMIAEMVSAGYTHYGEITVDKNPQAKAARTKDRGLLFVQLEKDSALMHMALADIVLHFRAPGDNTEPVAPECTREEWIRWARPVWAGADTDDDGILETDTLNAAFGRLPEDERHICPLQLGLIRRIVRLWSNRGDLVYSPFAGIGSEGVVAISLGRRFVGGELKRSYFNVAVSLIRAAAAQGSLF